MGFTMPLLLLLLLVLAVIWIVLVWKGVDPARLLRSSFKSPQHFLTPASYAERAKLLASVHAHHAGPRTGQTLLYSDAISQLALCGSVAEMEEILQFVFATRLINSDIKAQHFAQHCQRKLPLRDLSLTTLSMVITALHRYVKFRVVADCVQHCIEATSGADCLALKNALERTVSLYRLVCQRISFTDVREAIMVHLEREAATLTASPAFVRPIKLLCDIDDTMISVLFDTRYPDLTVYPGVHQFVEELLHCGLYASGAETTQSGSDPDSAKELRSRITFLTARPEIMRRRSVRQLRASGFFHFNLLMGKLSHVVLGPRRIALGKLENFESFRRLFAEHQFVFVGDNGQGDIDLGKDMLAQPEKYGVSVVLIHDIIRNHVRSATALAKAGVEIEAYRRQECERAGIHLFTTYIGAIATLYEQGLVDAAAVARVAQKTLAAHAAIVHETESQRELVEREVAWDVARVLDSMPEVRLESIVAELPTELQRLIEIKRMGRATDDATLNV